MDDAGTASPAEDVTLSIVSRCAARSLALPVALTPPPPTHPLDPSSLRRLCDSLKLSKSLLAAATEFSAPSGSPFLMASSAAFTPPLSAAFNAVSSARTGHVLVTSITLAADTAPSESLTSTATSTFPSASPPGNVPTNSGTGLKSFSCVHRVSPLTLAMNLYASGSSSSTHAAALIVNTVSSAVPDSGTEPTVPSDGGVFSSSSMNAAATPLPSSTSSRNLYLYPLVRTSGDSTRFSVASDTEDVKPAAARSTAWSAPAGSICARVADHDIFSVDASATEATVPFIRAGSPALTLFPVNGAMDADGGAPVAPAAAETTVTVVDASARLAPFFTSRMNSYVRPLGPAAPLSSSPVIFACESLEISSWEPSFR